MNPLVSVIIPVYNVEKYLEQCICSVVGQTYNNLEIILVNDGSPDKCPEICDKWAKKDSRIKVIHQKNQGLSASRNIGLTYATADYIYFVDSDDYVDCNLIKKCMSVFQTHNPDIVVFDAFRVNEKGEITGSTENISEICLDKKEALCCLAEGKIHDYAWNKVYKREVYENIFFPVKMKFEDIATTYKVFMKASSVYCLPEKLYYYRKRKSSIVGSMNPHTLRDLFIIRKKRYEDLKNDFPDAAEKSFKYTAVSALRFYDCTLWENIDSDAGKEAVKFLKENENKIRSLKIFALDFYLKHPKTYCLFRKAKHKIGNIARLLHLR